MPVDPDKIETVGDKKAAYFGSENIAIATESFGVTNYSQLRNMSFVAANGNITTYEVSYVGESVSIIYKVNGSTYYVGSDILKTRLLIKWNSSDGIRPRIIVKARNLQAERLTVMLRYMLNSV